MAFELGQIKKQLQDHLQEGLLLVVGSGPSIAEGIPSMGALAEHLTNLLPSKLATAPDDGWAIVAEALSSGQHLESAMGKATLRPTTVDAIVGATAQLVHDAERKVFEDVLAGTRVLPFTAFFKHLFKAAKKFHLITPNYDRLVEIAAEAASVGVDSRFIGYLHGRPDPKRSADAHRESYYSGRTLSFRSLPCLSVYKPHGSLDWFEVDGKVVRCPVALDRIPLIITPGTSKYREGYRGAFDDQRTAGNQAASQATRLLFIGYGFNDDHLEQHLCPNLKLERPTVIVAKHLSENARQAIKNSEGTDVIALSAVSESDLRTRITNQHGEETIAAGQLWDLGGFNKEVL